MEFIKYKKELLEDEKVFDALVEIQEGNGTKFIDELYKLGYKIEKI